MKKVFILIFITVVSVSAQKVTVVEDIALTTLSEGNFYYPTLNPDGTGVLYSRENHQGLWYKNLTSGVTIMITDALGAGYEPGFSINKSEIIFREDKFINGKRFSSLVSYDLVTKKSMVLDEGIRDLKICRSSDKISYNYVKGTELVPINKQNALQKNSSTNLLVVIENSNMVLYENNNKRVLDPLGNCNYIWSSISPDKTKLVFTCMGKGTFISNLEGKILAKLGYANYPSWSPDGNWIVFMKDIDDGEKVISSDIYITDLKGGNYYNLTLDRGHISMYPKWGNSNSEIFYNTDNGQIRKIKLNYE